MSVRRLFAVAAAVLVAAVGAWGAYRAARSVPEFYERALHATPEESDAAGEEFTTQSFALAGRVRRAGTWFAQFTDGQLNGWLAVDMPEKHPELLLPGFEQPRVRFVDDGLQIGCRCRTAGVETIIWIDAAATMTEQREVALRFRRVQAGRLPLPLARVLDAVKQAAEQFEVPLRWTTVDGDPTAIFGPPSLGNRWNCELDGFKLSAGRLSISGRTTPAAAARTAAERR